MKSNSEFLLMLQSVINTTYHMRGKSSNDARDLLHICACISYIECVEVVPQVDVSAAIICEEGQCRGAEAHF